MKKRTAFIFVLLSAFLTSCGITTNDNSSTRKVVLSSEETSEDTSEHDHSHDHSDTSESEETSSEDSSVVVDPCANGHTLLHYAPVAPTCLENGYEEGWFCEVCGRSFSTQPEGTVEESSGNSGKRVAPFGHSFPEDWTVIQVEDCTHDGIKEKKCVRCDEIERLVTKTTGHDWTGDEVITYKWDLVNRKVTATKKRTCSVEGELVLETKTVGIVKEEVIEEASCINNGTVKYTSASFGPNSSFEVQTTLKNVPAHHTLKKHNAVASTCVSHGNNVYYECIGGCDKFFSDPLAEHEILESSIPLELDPYNHIRTESQLAVEATCSHVGYNAHEVCTACGAKIDYIETPKLAHTPSTKWYSNSSGHYHICTKCNEVLADTLVTHTPDREAPTETIPVVCTECGYEMVPPTEHVCADRVALVNAVPSTCQTKGHIQYYECTCHKMYYDLAATNEITDPSAIVLDYASHNTTHVEAVVANCNMPGNIEYWHCNVCDKYFSDVACTTQITQSSTVIAKEDHNYSEAWTKDATFHWHACTKCGASEEKIPHTFNLDHATEDENKYCTVCGYIAETATGHLCKLHLVIHDAHDATCEAAGNTLYYECSVDHKYYSDENAENEIALEDTVIPATGHTPATKINEKPANCQETGIKEYYVCENCGNKIIEIEDVWTLVEDSALVIPINSNNHTHLIHHDAQEATCYQVGWDEYDTCVCGEYSTYHEIPMVDHSFAGQPYLYDSTHHWQTCKVCGELSAKVEHDFNRASASETENKYCKVCGYVAEYATGHTHSLTHYDRVEASCTETGNIEYWYCSGCDKYFSDAGASNQIDQSFIIIAAHHDYSDLITGSAATCSSTGTKDHYECNNCGTLFIKNGNQYVAVDSNSLIIPINPNNHSDLQQHAAVSASCTETGTIEYWYCSGCDNYYSNSTATTVISESDIIIPMTSHNYGEWEEETTPTCTTTGSKVRVCADCGAEQRETLPVVPHTTKHVMANDPTCTKDGNIEYWYCEVCKQYFEDNKYASVISESDTVIGKLGHSYEYTYEWNKTHTSVTATKTCTKCGYEIEETVSATSTITLEPTCLTKGKHTYTSNSFTTEGFEIQSIVVEDIPATEHDYSTDKYYVWQSGSKSVDKGKVCQSDFTHIGDVELDTRDDSSNKTTTLYTAASTISELANQRTANQKCGDLNIHFSNTGSVYGNPYDTTLVLNITHGNEVSSLADLLFIKIDNSYYYNISWHSGKSYALMYPNLTSTVNNNSNGFTNLGASDSLGHTTNLSSDTSFYNAMLEFTKDCEIIVRVSVEDDTRIATVKMIYNPKAAAYSEYVGYTQTFRIQYSEVEYTDYNYVNSVRIARPLATTGMTMTYFNCNEYVDRDVFSCNYNSGTSGSVTKTVVIDIDGKDKGF